MLYPLFRKALFTLDPEKSHDAALAVIGQAGRVAPAARLMAALNGARQHSLPTEVAGLNLINPVGLAAGLDKHAHATAGFLAMGFGSVETGTVTPLPQDGNPRPRMFRLASHEAVINRMGFNSVGFERFRQNFQREPLENAPGAIGINIGKNAATPLERAADDYIAGLEFAHGLGDYTTVNVSSPNTQDLRSLQSGDELSQLLERLAEARLRLNNQDGKRPPVFIKIAPDDMNDQTISHIVESAVATGIDGIINTNTTVGRSGVEGSPHAQEAGGLSGQPIRELSRNVNRSVCAAANGRLAVIACGGIDSADEAWTRLLDGASSIQLYTALIYRGPAVVADILSGLERKVASLQSTDLAGALARARSSGASAKA